MNRAILVLAFSGLAIGNAWEAMAGTYGYLPDLPITLGKGFSPKAPMEDHMVCLAGFGSRPLNGNASERTTASATIVRSGRDLKSVLGIDMRMEASILLYSGSNDFSYSAEKTVSEDDVNIVIQGDSVFSGETLDLSRARYLPEVQALIDQRRFREVSEKCGVELVNTVRKGTSISVIVSIHDLSESEKVRLGFKINGSGGFGPLSASAESSLNSFFGGTHASGRYSMTAVIKGGAGLPTVADMVQGMLKKPGNLTELQAGIKNALASLGAEKAALTGFSTIPFPYVELNRENLVSDRKAGKLGALVEVYRRAKSKHDSVYPQLMQAMYEGRPSEKLRRVSESLMANAWREAPAAEDFVARVAKAHQACLNDNTPELKECALPRQAAIPSMDLLYMILGQI